MPPRLPAFLRRILGASPVRPEAVAASAAGDDFDEIEVTSAAAALPYAAAVAPTPGTPAPPVTPAPDAGGKPVVSAYMVRNDGLTGAAVARGIVPFKPGAVLPADLATLTAWDAQGNEIALYVEGDNATAGTAPRHYGTPYPNSITHAWVEAAMTVADTNTRVPLTFRFDRPVGVARRTKSPATMWTQRVQLSVPPGAVAPSVNALSLWWHDDDLVRRAPAHTVVLHTVFFGGAPIARHASDMTVLHAFLAFRKSDGKVYLVPTYASTGAVASNPSDQYWGNVWGWIRSFAFENEVAWRDYTVIGAVALFIKPGSGNFTLGTTPLDDPMVAGLTLADDHVIDGKSARGVFAVPTNVPAATITADDPAYLVESALLPWPITTSAAAAAIDGDFAAVEAAMRVGADDQYRKVGPGMHTEWNNGLTTYGPIMQSWETFARFGTLRDLRRAMGAWHPWRRPLVLDGNGRLSHPSGGADEATGDTSMAPWAWLLMQHADAEGHLADFLVRHDFVQRQFYGRFDGNLAFGKNGTTRHMMHVFEGLVCLKRLGATATTEPIAANGGGSDASFPQGGSPADVGLAAIHARAGAWLVYNTVTRSSGPTAGQRVLVQAAYETVGPFMLGWMLTWAALAERVLGPVAGVHEVIRDSMAFLFTAPLGATRSNGSTLLMLSETPGREQFFYSEASDQGDETYAPRGARVANVNGPGTELNGTHFGALAYLLTADAGNAAAWRARGDLLYRALKYATLDYHGKELGEAGLVAPTWPAVR